MQYQCTLIYHLFCDTPTTLLHLNSTYIYCRVIEVVPLLLHFKLTWTTLVHWSVNEVFVLPSHLPDFTSTSIPFYHTSNIFAQSLKYWSANEVFALQIHFYLIWQNLRHFSVWKCWRSTYAPSALQSDLGMYYKTILIRPDPPPPNKRTWRWSESTHQCLSP